MEDWKRACKKASLGMCSVYNGHWMQLSGPGVSTFLRELSTSAIRYSRGPFFSCIDIIYVGEREVRLSISYVYDADMLFMDGCSNARKETFDKICVLLGESDDFIMSYYTASKIFEIMKSD